MDWLSPCSAKWGAIWHRDSATVPDSPRGWASARTTTRAEAKCSERMPSCSARATPGGTTTTNEINQSTSATLVDISRGTRNNSVSTSTETTCVPPPTPGIWTTAPKARNPRKISTSSQPKCSAPPNARMTQNTVRAIVAHSSTVYQTTSSIAFWLLVDATPSTNAVIRRSAFLKWRSGKADSAPSSRRRKPAEKWRKAANRANTTIDSAPTSHPPVANTQDSAGPRAASERRTRPSAKPNMVSTINTSYMRSSTNAAICEEVETFSLLAIRYGRTNSPGRPNMVIALKPITVAENRFHRLGSGLTGRISTRQRNARP